MMLTTLEYQLEGYNPFIRHGHWYMLPFACIRIRSKDLCSGPLIPVPHLVGKQNGYTTVASSELATRLHSMKMNINKVKNSGLARLVKQM